MQKQVWLFLTGTDEAWLLAEAQARGARLLRGRFFRGTVEQLREAPEELEVSAARRGEQVTYLLPPWPDAALVADAVTEGPWAGWSRLDEVRSEVVALVRPEPETQGLAPARLVAATHAWLGGQRLRKSPQFNQWAGQLLDVAAALPCTAFDWMHVAPDARAWAERGGRLHYLYRTVALTPPPGLTPVTRPHQGR